MTGDAAALFAHLGTGVTNVVRCWEVVRSDGVRLGFTDHDLDLSFDGLTFKAESGLTARALEQGTGLSVDNSEAMGALSDAALSEADIEAGRYDAAEVVAWLVNWQDVGARQVLFRGHIGEIRRAGGAFQAELRGLSDLLNRPVGRIYQRPCTAVLGDATCGVDLTQAGFVWEGAVTGVIENRKLVLPGLPQFLPGWFERGRAEMLSGAAAGLTRWIKRDRILGETRQIDLWEPFRADLAPGDQVRIAAGCDKRFGTCREKFDNLVNYQGFPDIPGDDFLVVHPANASNKAGGSRR
ncbi:hypothetical protein FIU97_04545 [Roseivivax sp. THAF40]|uniref:DUF2163 domain-containing protein n=1 Tax=unclassified Roseivivax TaxID=2639302 RepID=UPI00126908FA|nr:MULTISPECIES: DUF2163 domain-containing protein [unclassified Roseivivax]QFS82039.1 hypothetical protein FIV09_04285 [Roseivivax sp. THAF197b]QFT45839.1 hypothetical protein FIU97_04545 [Roseivivax sp. THAF40]